MKILQSSGSGSGVFINRKSSNVYENTVQSSKSIHSFTFSKAVKWARLESLPVQFQPPGLMFATPALSTAC